MGGVLLALLLVGEIPRPTDAPKPLAPAEAAKSFRLPAGFRMELVASEPLITEPTGVCWDEQGRLYVCELHGYNLEGQLEIDEMNKAGVLDTKVQRVQAAEKYKQAAKPGTYGVVKILRDLDGDGLMDKAHVLASNLPPAYGLCPARGGVIVACAPDIVFLADNQVRETLFTGFKTGMLERGINAPQWGPDGWIYVGRGWGGGKITGPRLAEPVQLPNTDFRIRPDGSAIEPVTGGTHTIGFAFTAEGDRFFTTTWKHALYAIPIEWRYLARNPDAAMPSLEADAANYTTVFPIAPVHPWKKARSNAPGWKELYGKYGISESAESGYFTSCCSPLVYQDVMFPEAYRGNLFVCEPAQNLVHRCLVERDGPGLKVRRAPGEEKKEFLASTDSWFRPVALAHGPDGAIWIVDMYREIIEDYSAVPRYMQQQYGVNHGADRGRIWRLVYNWPRQTAERLLRERGVEGAASKPTNGPRALLQKALKLGDRREPEAFEALVRMAREHADIRWMPTALMTGMHERAGKMLSVLLHDPGAHGAKLIEPLAASIAARRDPGELAEALAALRAVKPSAHREASLKALTAKAAPRAKTLVPKKAKPDLDTAPYVEALKGPRDLKRGRELFQQLCASCHRLKDDGVVVGPDLSLAFQRAEETLIRDILFPSELLTSSYETQILTTKDGEEISGVLVSESPTSITIRQGGGLEETILRKDLAGSKTSKVSLMPEGFGEVLTPRDCASLIAWLRMALLKN